MCISTRSSANAVLTEFDFIASELHKLLYVHHAILVYIGITAQVAGAVDTVIVFALKSAFRTALWLETAAIVVLGPIDKTIRRINVKDNWKRSIIVGGIASEPVFFRKTGRGQS
jgi:hypothetical protein